MHLVVDLVLQPEFGPVDGVLEFNVLRRLRAHVLLNNGLGLGVSSKGGLKALKLLEDAAMRLTGDSLHVDNVEALPRCLEDLTSYMRCL